MKFDIWEEPYFVQGMDKPSDPKFIGSYEADSFKEACLKANAEGKFGKDFNEETLTDWGCRLFQTKEEAEWKR